MKATQVGQSIAGNFNFELYLAQKYEGFWEGCPSKKDIQEAKGDLKRDMSGDVMIKIALHKKLKTRAGFFREWKQLQRG